MIIPYTLIPFIVMVVLSCHHILVTDASSLSKWMVGGLTAISITLWWWFPGWSLAAMFLQILTSIYLLLYLRATSRERSSRNR